MAAPRWTALAASAAIALAAFGIGAERLAAPPAVHAIVATAIGATIEQNGHTGPLSASMELEPGDTVVAGSLGSATIRLDVGEARLAAGAMVRIDELRGGRVVLEQLRGRVYHRTAASGAGDYVVATGSVTWTAVGTAFDLDREPMPGSTLERITGTAIEESILVHGPSLAGTIVEGRQATVILGTETPEVTTAETPAAWYTDPWVAENARLDRTSRGGPDGHGRDAAADERPGP